MAKSEDQLRAEQQYRDAQRRAQAARDAAQSNTVNYVKTNDNSSPADAMGTSMRGEIAPWKPASTNFNYGQNQYGAEDATRRYQGMAGDFQNRGAYQLDASQQNAARGFQSAAAADYLRSLNGQNPSFANAQMQRGLNQAQANSFSLANSARGGGANMAAAQRNALLANNQQANAVNTEAGMQAIKEREAARQGLANVGGQMRGQDINFATAQGQMEMGQRSLNDNTALGYERLSADVQGQELQARQNYEKLRQEAELAQRGQNFEVQKFNKSQGIAGVAGVGALFGNMFSSDRGRKKDTSSRGAGRAMGEMLGDEPSNEAWSNGNDLGGGAPGPGWTADNVTPRGYHKLDEGDEFKKLEAEQDKKKDDRGKSFQAGFEKHFGPRGGENEDLVSGAGKLGAGVGAMFSDRRVKKSVGKAGDSKLQDFARKMQPKTFRYKEEPESAPKRVGVMAQDMEKSEMGDSAVVETPGGKMVDMPRAVSLALAAIAEMRDELDSVRGGGKVKTKKGA